MSVPTPNGDPPNAIKADSPPEEPPGVSDRFRGFRVRPVVLLIVSGIIIAVLVHCQPLKVRRTENSRHVCLAVENGAGGFQQFDYCTIILSGIIDP